jgi:serine/threonine protein kinase
MPSVYDGEFALVTVSEDAVWKQSKPDAISMRLMRNERDVLRRLGAHPNIVRVLYDADERPDLLGLEVGVCDLIQYVDQEGAARDALDAAERGALLRHVGPGILDALMHCHGRGVSHRDVKPDNIILMRDLTPRLIDFAYARVVKVGAAATVFGGVGTAMYAAPEIVASGDDEGYDGVAADAWSVGVMLYAIATWSQPWGKRADDTDERYVRWRGGRALDPAVKDEWLRAAVDALLKVRPSERASLSSVRASPYFGGAGRADA